MTACARRRNRHSGQSGLSLSLNAKQKQRSQMRCLVRSSSALQMVYPRPEQLTRGRAAQEWKRRDLSQCGRRKPLDISRRLSVRCMLRIRPTNAPASPRRPAYAYVYAPVCRRISSFSLVLLHPAPLSRLSVSHLCALCAAQSCSRLRVCLPRRTTTASAPRQSCVHTIR